MIAFFIVAAVIVFTFGYAAERRVERMDRGWVSDRELRRRVRVASRWAGVALRAPYAEIGYFPPRRWRR